MPFHFNLLKNSLQIKKNKKKKGKKYIICWMMIDVMEKNKAGVDLSFLENKQHL